MIKIEKTDIYGIEAAIRGMRNAKNSWSKADSMWGFLSKQELQDKITEFIQPIWKEYIAKNNIEDEAESDKVLKALEEFYLTNSVLNTVSANGEDISSVFLMGPNDMRLASTLASAGTDHGKFLRQIGVSVDITAPLFWWKEFDTYKVGTTANSTSTMHTITNSAITLESFSFECMLPGSHGMDVMCDMITIVSICENLRKKYLEYKDSDEKLAAAYWRALIELLPNGWLQTRTVTLNYAVLRNIYKARKNHKLSEWHTLCAWIESLPYFSLLIE